MIYMDFARKHPAEAPILLKRMIPFCMNFFSQAEITWEVKDHDGKEDVGENAVPTSSHESNKRNSSSVPGC
jgi:hypothetical protein